MKDRTRLVNGKRIKLTKRQNDARDREEEAELAKPVRVPPIPLADLLLREGIITSEQLAELS